MISTEGSQFALEGRLGVRFNDSNLLQRALIHGSVLNENPESPDLTSNERMEFLGDAVLGHVVAIWLYEEMPDAPEGDLTRARSALVSRESLAEVARSLEIGEVLRLGKGEAASGGGARDANLADALEAVIGAVYLDQGERVATRAIKAMLATRFREAVVAGATRDAKSLLQEIIQARHKQRPEYVTIDERGPKHEKEFTVEVRALGEFMAKGVGPNKRAAEQAAAKSALELIDRPDAVQ